jgi:TolB-like protein
MLTVVPAPSPVPEAAEARAKKKKDKVRSAWISFAGRIVAQVTGAAVSVALTLMVLHQVKANEPAQASPAPPQAVASVSTTTPAGIAAGRTAPAIAVLPLDNFSGNPAQDAFADGMTEALIAELAQVKGLTVISRTSAMRYRRANKPLPEIARELGATHLVEGSLVADMGRLRVTAQLIDAASDRHVWAHTYDRPARDVLGVQSEVARTIAEEVGASIAAAIADR